MQTKWNEFLLSVKSDILETRIQSLFGPEKYIV